MKIEKMKDYVRFIVDSTSSMFFKSSDYVKAGKEPEAVIADLADLTAGMLKPSIELLHALEEIKDSDDIPDLPINANLSKFKQPDQRPTWDAYFLGIAMAVSARSTCIRRKYGAVLVKNNVILATGYNGAPKGAESCLIKGTCERQNRNIPSGKNYELCESVHAEANALLAASKEEALGATMYIAGYDVERDCQADATPCLMCTRLLRNAGVKIVIHTKLKEDYDIKVEQVNKGD